MYADNIVKKNIHDMTGKQYFRSKHKPSNHHTNKEYAVSVAIVFIIAVWPNHLTTKLFICNFHSLEFVFRRRDPHLQVNEN